jgi:peptidoglycan-N-acetylmuramic acid deacetylase
MRSRIIGVVFILLLILSVTGCNHQALKDSNPSPTPTPAPAQTQTPVPEKTTSQASAAPTEKADEPAITGSSAPSVKSYSWYFIRNSQHQIPAANRETADLLAANNAFYVLPNSDSKIYLTFDAGYELGYTPRILDILSANGVHAAFFITGQYLNTQPELVKRMKQEGNLVCNHTLNHPDCAKISSDKLKQEIQALEEKYAQITGRQMDRYLRPPMGNYSELSLKTTSELGYKTVFWSMAFADWDPAKQPGADYAYNHVMDNIHPGAVILLHAVSQSDTEALDRIIKDLQAQGYVFATFE